MGFRFQVILGLTLVLASTIHAESIESICGDVRPLPETNSPAAYRLSLVALQSRFTGFPQISSAFNDYLASEESDSPVPAIKTTRIQTEVLRTLARAYPLDSTASATARALERLVARFSEDDAFRISHSREYFSALDEAIAENPFTHDAWQCFHGGPTAHTTEGRVENVAELPEFGAEFQGMAFRPTAAGPAGKYFRSLYFQPRLLPVDALVTLAHEMWHSCHADAAIEQHELELSTKAELASGAISPADVQEFLLPYWQHSHAVEEIAAFQFQYRAFRSFAGNFPRLICDGLANYYGSLRRMGDHYADMERGFEAGTYPQKLLSLYVKNGRLRSELIFVSENGKTRLHPKLVKRLRDAGLNVTP